MAPVNIIRDAGYGFGTPEETKAAELERIRERTGEFLNLQGEVIEDVAATPAQLGEEKGLVASVHPLVDEHTRPSSIRVYRPLRSGALACKMYGWYRVYHPRSSSYDVRDDTYDQVYRPGNENIDPDTTQAINNVGGIGVDRADGVLFMTHYWAGNYDPGRYGPPSCPTDGWMWQKGTVRR